MRLEGESDRSSISGPALISSMPKFYDAVDANAGRPVLATEEEKKEGKNSLPANNRFEKKKRRKRGRH